MPLLVTPCSLSTKHLRCFSTRSSLSRAVALTEVTHHERDRTARAARISFTITLWSSAHRKLTVGSALVAACEIKGVGPILSILDVITVGQVVRTLHDSWCAVRPRKASSQAVHGLCAAAGSIVVNLRASKANNIHAVQIHVGAYAASAAAPSCN